MVEIHLKNEKIDHLKKKDKMKDEWEEMIGLESSEVMRANKLKEERRKAESLAEKKKKDKLLKKKKVKKVKDDVQPISDIIAKMQIVVNADDGDEDGM